MKRVGKHLAQLSEGAPGCVLGHAFSPAFGRVLRAVLWSAALLPLAACDQLGIETPQRQTERKVAEAKAVGGACRHALRAIEDCYTLNPKSDKSAVYDGWREMDEYMRENSLDGIAPVVPRPDPKARRKAASSPEGDEEEEVIEDERPASAARAK